jgi:very-short-patch-repair endonuclease
MRDGVNGKLAFRRRLRREQTDAERKLWSLLRSRQLEAYKFRRQHPIGPYTADFVCLERRLVIELDGGQHAGQLSRDKKREEFFQGKQFRILRFWDNELLKEPQVVVERSYLN